jgi:hypothetical protein
MTSPVVPELMSTIGNVALAPKATEPKPREEGLDFSDTPAAPTPPMSTTSFLLEALEVNAKPPPSQPPTVGANVTLSAALCPAPSTNGSFRFGTENSPDVELSAEIVTLLDPLFVSVIGKDALEPITMVPKCSCDGFALICAALEIALAGNRAIRTKVAKGRDFTERKGR